MRLGPFPLSGLRRLAAAVIAGAAGAALAGCAAAPDDRETGVSITRDRSDLAYDGVHTRLLDDDLVNFRVAMRGASGPVDVSLYAECAAAQYTLIRGYSYARHVRTNVAEEGGIWQADAVYTISAALPQGLQTIDAEFTVDTCNRAGVPTV